MLEAHGAVDERRRARRPGPRVARGGGAATVRRPDDFLSRYPHQLSGGQQQRVAIAMAFANRPHVIVCDEPTTGLDVTTQARVLKTVRELCQEHGVAALYVSHDLAVVAELADHVAVMYAGRIIERGPRDVIFSNPRHPYTRRLLRAVPDLEGKRAVLGIPGRAPLPGNRPDGCFFAPRCDLAIDQCTRGVPASRPPMTAASTWSAATAPTTRRRRSGSTGEPAPLGPAGDVVLALSAHRRQLRLASDPARRRLRGPPQPVRGPGRRVRLGQDDDRALRRRPAPPVHGRDQARRRQARPGGARAHAPTPASGSSTCSRTRTRR